MHRRQVARHRVGHLRHRDVVAALDLFGPILHSADPRVVDEDVEPPVVGRDLGEHFGDRGAVGDVERVRVATELVGEFPTRRLGQVGDDRRRTLVVEPPSDLRPEPSGCPGDECDLARQSAFVCGHSRTLESSSCMSGVMNTR